MKKHLSLDIADGRFSGQNRFEVGGDDLQEPGSDRAFCTLKGVDL